MTKSQGRILRDVRRITKFLEKKKMPVQSSKLSIVHHDTFSIPPKPKSLSIQKRVFVDIPPDKYSTARLSRTSFCCVNIPPVEQPARPIARPYLHPFVVEASKMLYGKPPWELTPEQAEHFEGYQEYKTRNGRPIEEDICYKPRDLF